jgi:hypothetical protein
LQAAAPFDLLALFVSHCMLLGESDPPQASGVLWSTSFPGHAPEVFPVDGHGWLFLNEPFAVADLSILPWESRLLPSRR